jgi:hypothetical protein
MSFGGVAESKLLLYDISVSAAHALEIRDDSLGSSLGYTYASSDIAYPSLRFLGDIDEHMSMI